MGDKTYAGSKGIYKKQGGLEMWFVGGTKLVMDTLSKLICGFGLGTPVVNAAIVTEEQFGHIHRTSLTFTNYALATVDSAGNAGIGSLTAYTFPRGNIQFLGATSNLTIAAAAGIGATAAVVMSVGTVAAANDATLTGTEANLIPSTACTLTGSAGAMKGKSTATQSAFFDNTTTTNATQMPAILNAAVPDASSSANSTLTLNGTLTFTWINHGDN